MAQILPFFRNTLFTFFKSIKVNAMTTSVPYSTPQFAGAKRKLFNELMAKIKSSKLLMGVFFILSILLLNDIVVGQTQTFTSSGTFTVPANVTTMTVYVWGAGGGGGGGSNGCAQEGNGGGGGGGGFATKILTVSSGQVYTITVGAGGTAGASGGGSTAGTGGNTTITGTGGTVSATGGTGGAGNSSCGTVAGGTGGTGTAGTGITTYTGGGGSTGQAASSGVGSGGGGAGSGGNGGTVTNGTCPGSGGAGGTGTYTGGAGGYLSSCATNRTNATGVAGSVPGGGGSGGQSYNVNAAGGSGGGGEVIIVYTVPCATPSAPTAIAATTASITSSSIPGTITAPSTAPTGYIVINSTSSTLSAGPANGTTYTAGSSTVGGGTVQYINTSTSFTETGTLAANTTYYLFAYSYNSGCSGAPYYSSNTGTTANTSATTLPGVPTATAGTSITSSSFSANWSAPTNGATGYYLDVSTSSTFASFVTGYNNLNVGNVTTYSVTGLSPSTTYYYRVRAYNVTGSTASSSTITVATTVATYTWTGATNTDWNTGTNWSTGSVPGASSIVVIPSVTNQPIISSATAAVCGTITLNSGTSLTVTGTLNDAGNWTNNGGTVSGTGTVTLSGATTTIGGTASNSFPNLISTGTSVTMASNTTVNGNFTASAGQFNVSSSSSSYTLAITGNYIQSGANVVVFNGANNSVVTVAGSFTNSAGILALELGTTATGASFTVNGSGGTTISGTGIIIMDYSGANTACTFQTTSFTASGTGGTSADGNNATCSVDFGNGSSTNYCLFKISGNFLHSSTNTFYTSGTAQVGSFIFNGTGTQTLSYAGTNSAYTSCTINSGSTVQLLTNFTQAASGSPSSIITVNGTLDCQTYIMSGSTSCTFTLSSGATLKTANVNGIYSGTVGSISSGFATRTFNSAANYIFNGTAAQTANFSNATMNNLTVNNTLTGATALTINAPTTVAGTLTLTSGIVATTTTNTLSVTNSATAAVTGGTTSSFVNGPLNWALLGSLAKSSNTTYNFPVGAGTTYLPFTIDSLTTGATGPTLQITAFGASAGGSADGTTLTAVSSTEYWSSSLISGTVTNASVSLTRQAALSPYNAIGKSSTKTGSYSSIAGTVSGTSVLNSTNVVSGAQPYYYLFGTLAVPSLTISDNGTQIAAQNLTINTTNDTISLAKIVSALATSTTLNSVTFVTSSTSTYTTADIGSAGFKLWYSTTNKFSTAAQIGSGVSSVSGPGESIIFGSLGLSLPNGTYYFWLTTNITAGATAGHTIIVNGLTNTSVTVTGATVSGSTSTTGTQTIIAACTTPTTPTSIGSILSTPTTVSGSIGGTSATGYVVLFSTAPITPSLANGTTYTQGAAFNATTTIGYVNTSPSFVSSTLASNTNYYIYAFAYNNTNCSGGPLYSGYIQSSQYTCIAAPTGLNATSVASTTATLNWTANAGTVTSYTLDVSTTTSFGAGNDIPGFPVSVTSGTSYNVTGLNVNTTYYYQLTAINTSNTSTCGTSSPASATANFTTVDATLATDYFQSKATGNWSAPGTWLSSHNGSSFITATAAPTSAAKSVFITNTNTSTTGNYSAVVITVDVPSTSGPLDIQATTGTTAASNTTNLIMNANLYVNGYVEIDGPTAYSAGTPNIDSLSVGNNTLTVSGNLVFDGTYATTSTYRQARLCVGGGSGVVNIYGSVNETKNSGADQIYFTGAGTNGKINVKGDWNYPSVVLGGATTSVVNGTGTISFSGTAVQNINSFSTTTFPNLNDSNTTANLLVHGNISITNNLKMIGANSHLIPDSAVTINSGGAAGIISGNGIIETTSNGLPSPTAPAASFVAQYKFSTYSLSAMTVDYTANGNQTVNAAAAPYGNLLINAGNTPQLDFGSGIKTLDGALGSGTVNGVNGYLQISAGSFSASGSNYNVTLGGNWIDNTGSASGNFTAGTGTVYFNGGAAQAITGTSTGQTFNNINTVAVGTALSVAGSTTTLKLNNAMTIGNSTTLAAGTASSIYVGGNWNDNTGTVSGGFSPGTGSYTIFFNGKTAQTINGTATGQTFNNMSTLYPGTGSTSISIANSTTTLNVNGTMTIGATTALAAGTATSINMVAGNWIDNTVGGTGGFTPGSANTVYFKGIAPQTITGGTGNTTQTFNSITTRYPGSGTNSLSVTGSTATLNLLSNMTIGATTAFAAGTASGIYVGKNWIDSTTSGGFAPGSASNLVTFNGGILTQTISGTATSQTFNNLSTSGSNTLVTVGSSTFGTNTSTLNINGTMTIGTGSLLKAGSAGTINITGNWLDNTAGATGGFNAGTSNTVYFKGSNPQTITGGATNSGQTFNNITVQNTGAGSVAGNGTTTTLNLNSLLLFSGSLTAGTATTINVAGNWTNNISSSAFAAGTGSVTFNGSSTLGSPIQLINGSQPTSFGTLNIQSGTSTTLAVNTTIAGSLNVSTGSTNSIFDIVNYSVTGSAAGNLFVQGFGTLRLSGTSGPVTGSNFPSGFNHNSLTQFSTTEYYDASGTGQTIAVLSGAQAFQYGNLTLTGNSVKTAPSGLTINNNLLINTNATFAAGSFTHNVASSWTNNGTFTGTGGTINFNGGSTGNGILGNLTGSNQFYYLTFNGSGAWSFGNPADVGADFTLTNGSVTAPAGLLNVGGNWINNGGSFSPNGGTVSLNGSIVQAIKGSNATTFGTLNINNSAGLKDTVQVATSATTLSFTKGYLDISANSLALSSPAVIAGASSTSFVVTGYGSGSGKLIVTGVTTTGFAFPVGVDSAGLKFYYLPASIAPTTGGLTWSGQVFIPVTPTAVYGAAPYSGAALSGIVNAEWIVTPSTTNTTAALTLNWVPQLEGSTFQIYADSYIGISHYQGTPGSGSWNPATGTASHAGHTVTATFASFSPFGIGASGQPLPVILVDFNAILNNNRTVGLTWTTQQEVNTADFEVQRSADGIVWTTIGTVPAAGNSSLPSNYDFTDVSPLSSNFYRIKMVNINGAFGFTTERFIKLLQVKEILVFPNPARNYVNVSVSKAEVDLNVKLINQVGQVMQVMQVKAGSGTLLTFDLHNYAQGTYFVQVSGSDGTMQTNKVIIMR